MKRLGSTDADFGDALLLSSDGLIGTIDAARLLDVAPTTIQRWIDKGHIDSVRTPGGHRRICRKDLLAFAVTIGFKRLEDGNSADVIIVDDDPKMLELLQEYISLIRTDIRIHTVSNSFEAGLSIMRHKPKLVLLDLVMPGMNGTEICRQIKKQTVLTHTKVIGITGHVGGAIVDEMKAAGADEVLFKPVSLETLEPFIIQLSSGVSAR